MRLFTLYHRMRHTCLTVAGRFSVVVIWPLFLTTPFAPYCWVAWPIHSGGTFTARIGGLMVIWRVW